MTGVGNVDVIVGNADKLGVGGALPLAVVAAEIAVCNSPREP